MTHFASHSAATACPTCKSSECCVLATRDGKTNETLLTVVCNVCGLGRTDPLPSKEELHRWYTTDYRQDYKKHVHPDARHVLRAGTNALARWQWLRSTDTHKMPQWFARSTDNGGLAGAKLRSLDVGASSGEFVFLMAQRGFDATGVEPNDGYRQYGEQTFGISTVKGSLDDAFERFPQSSFSLITMFHVLEHVVDPVQTLGKLRHMLSPDGVILIEVPNTNRLTRKHTLFFRAHTLHFSRNSLQQTLEAAGLEVAKISPATDDNLLVVARAQPAISPRVQFVDDGDIVAAHKRRQPHIYGWHQITTLTPLRKLQRQVKERFVARKFSCTKQMLTGLYEGYKNTLKAFFCFLAVAEY